jgi:hypothetical protein
MIPVYFIPSWQLQLHPISSETADPVDHSSTGPRAGCGSLDKKPATRSEGRAQAKLPCICGPLDRVPINNHYTSPPPRCQLHIASRGNWAWSEGHSIPSAAASSVPSEANAQSGKGEISAKSALLQDCWEKRKSSIIQFIITN